MTERRRASVERGPQHFAIGPSSLRWRGDHLQIELNELCAPLPYPVRGSVRLYPSALSTFMTSLDTAGRHRWGPIAACARIEVDLQNPRTSWKGEAYFDSNEGDEPVDQQFEAWDWSRARLKDGSTAVLYDIRQADGVQRVIAQRFSPDGRAQAFAPPSVTVALPRSLWQIQRSVRADDSATTRLLQTLEDAPFYNRSLLQTSLLGEAVTAVHETLQAQRLSSLPVRLMLPWRMPRWN